MSTPSVGRPRRPASVQAALSSEAFTPYAALGQSNNDGLAPGESGTRSASACMNDAGYPNSAHVPFAISLGAREPGVLAALGGVGLPRAPPRRSSTASGFPPAPR